MMDSLSDYEPQNGIFTEPPCLEKLAVIVRERIQIATNAKGVDAKPNTEVE